MRVNLASAWLFSCSCSSSERETNERDSRLIEATQTSASNELTDDYQTRLKIGERLRFGLAMTIEKVVRGPAVKE